MDRIRLVKMLLVLLCLVVGVANGGNFKNGGGFNTRIADISDNLGRALNRAIDFGNETYTENNETVEYTMDVHWDPKGFGDFYNITLLFMDLVLPKNIIPDDIELPVDENGNIDLNSIVDKISSLLNTYAGLLTLVIIGVIFMILMPLIGIIFCCCRCCGNCGARSQPFDKKHDTCRKVVLAMLLICVATLILFGVVCAFVSNKHIQEGIEELPNETRDGLADLKTYIKNTDSQIKTVLTTNFDELDLSLVRVLKNSSKIISEELANLSNATSFTSLANFVGALERISADLQYMKLSTNALRVNASQLNDGLRRVKNELLQSLKLCTVPQCASVKEEINRMKTTMDFDQYLDRYFPKLPDVTETFVKLIDIVNNGQLIEQINKGKESFSKIEKNIGDSIKKNIPLVEKTLSDTGDSLNKSYLELSNTLGEVKKMLGDNSKAPIDTAERFIQEYSKYRYLVGLIQSSILLLVIICISFGLMCGVCGTRPDGYDDDCCNKGTGSRFLMIGVAIMFFFSLFLMLITIVYFLTGSIAQKVVCDTLKNPKDNRMFTMIDRFVHIDRIVNSNISSIIETCHQNESAYNVLRLEDKFNITDLPMYLKKFGITEQIEKFKENIKFTDKIKLMTDDTKLEIQKLKDSGIGDLSFDSFMRVLEHNITSIDLVVMAKNLMKLADMIDDPKMISSLKHNALILEMYQKKLVEPMVNTAYELKIKSEQIENDRKLNHEGDFNHILDEVEIEIQQTEEYINNEGKDKITDIANGFSEKFQERILSYIYFAGNKTLKDIGKCGPLSNVYNATLIATCDKIFNPWNGFWVCMGWCLFLFIPCIIISVKLSTLYQKSESYPGPLVEAVPHKKGKKKRTRAEMYETRGYAGERSDHRATPRERDAPGGSSHPDTRYADMAPKHWDDYPNGGPPHYQSSAPIATEYERPPPYYYPGPGDRQ